MFATALGMIFGVFLPKWTIDLDFSWDKEYFIENSQLLIGQIKSNK
jgi:hypothetical protein